MKQALLILALFCGVGHAQILPPILQAPPTGGANSLALFQSCFQNNTGSATSNAIAIDSSNVNCSGPSNPGTGRLVHVYSKMNNAAGAVCTDTLGNTIHTTIDTTNEQLDIWLVIAAGGADTLTCTTTFNSSAVMLSQEFSGQNATPSDNAPSFSAQTANTAWTLPSITTTHANDVVIGCAGNISVNMTYTSGSGYSIPTKGQVSGGGQSAFCEYQLVTATGAYQPTATASASNTGSTMSVSFKSQ